MPITINGTTGIAGVDGSASAPALQGSDSNTGVFFGTDTVTVATGGTAAVTVDSGQRTKFPTTIGVGNATPSTSGSGITFPATESLSSDANTLDDYEEGTYTVSVTMGSGTATVFTSTTGLFSYVKIGNLVTIHGEFNLNPVSSPSGTFSINLPFTSKNTSRRSAQANAAVIVNNVGVPASGVSPCIRVVANSASAQLYWVTSSGTLSNMVATLNGDYGVTLTYEAA